MSNRLHTDKIEAFLTGQMSPEESRSFEQRLAQDEDLAIEVEMQRLEHDAMELMLETDLKSKIAKWKDNPPPNPFPEPLSPPPAPPTGTGGWKRWLPLLGAAVVVLGGVWFFTRPGDTPVVSPTPPVRAPFDPMKEQIPVVSNDPTVVEQPATPKEDPKLPDAKELIPQKESAYLALALNEYETPSFDSGQRGNGAEKSVVEEAEAAFDGKQYAKTIELLSKPEAGNESQVRYLRGHAYFKLKKYQKAAAEFESVASNGFAPNSQDAKWYLLLTYLAQAPAARANFLKLAEEMADERNMHAKRAEAVNLLEQFRQLK